MNNCVDEVDKGLEIYKLPNVTQEKLENLNLPITTKETTDYQILLNKEKPVIRWAHW